jgi:hypothetical protein
MTKLIGAVRDGTSTPTNKYGGPTACRQKLTVVKLISASSEKLFLLKIRKIFIVPKILTI